MTEDTQQFEYTQEWLAQKLERDKQAAQKEAQERREEREKESLERAWLATGGTREAFEKAYPHLVAQKRREDTLEADRAHRAYAARQLRQQF